METFKQILTILMEVVIIPAIPIVVIFAIDAFKKWSDSKVVEVENKKVASYLSDITNVIAQAVMSTTQTYVDSLKAQGKFTEEAQKVAFEKTKSTIMNLLAQDAKDFIAKMYGDVDLWLDTKIEQIVKLQK